MRKNKLLIGTLLLGCVLLTACGSSSSTSDKTESTTNASDFQSFPGAENMPDEKGFSPMQMDENTVMGMIECIDDSSITIASMGMGRGQMPGGNFPQGERLEMPSGDFNFPEGEMPEMPSGDFNFPEGEMPEMPSGDFPQGESSSQSITITKDTVITDANGNAIALSDLAEGSMITATLDDNKNAVSISIFNMDMNFNPENMPKN